MRIMVTGASGLLGEDIADIFSDKHEVLALRGRKQLDVTNAGEVFRLAKDYNPDFIINSAGWRDVDDVEKSKEKALLVNVLGVKNLTLAAAKTDSTIIQISSDSIFSGEKESPYNEFDLPSPVNIYGYSKFMAEEQIKSLANKYFIVRVPLLFGLKGYKESNSIYDIYKKLKNEEDIYSPTDQICSPTYTADVAEVLLEMIETEFYGIYHVTNSGLASRYELTRKVVELMGFDIKKVLPITSDKKYAKRPKNTAFNCLAYNATFKTRLTSWEDALNRCLKNFNTE